ncbi:hypothetical protein V2J09_013775 [Rumex salicifolius]
MADEGEGVMNLDLNLGPVSPVSGGPANGTGSSLVDPVNLEDWVEQSLHRRFREALRQRNRQRWRWRDRGHARMPFENQDISVNLMVDSSGGEPIGGTMQTGEGSSALEMSNDGIAKMCENMVGQPESETLDKNEDVDKGSNGDGSSFFDCNICLDLAKDPVVTSCGHLFCWPCLYRWLHIHSDAKECPVCKGEVTVKNVTPIFGRGNGTRELDEDPGVKIPDRPPARRVESLRQAIQRTAFSIPMEEMIRRLGSRFDLTRDFFQQQEGGGGDGPRTSTLERTNSLLNRILMSRGIRREQNVVLTSDNVGLNPDNEPRPEFVEQRRLPQLFYRRSHTNRVPPPPPLPPHLGLAGSGTSSTERFFDSFIRNPGMGRSQEQIPSTMEDRDSISSIMAVIHGESQTMDTAVEIESTVSLSTSSSRRRHDASRMSDVDSGDSHQSTSKRNVISNSRHQVSRRCLKSKGDLLYLSYFLYQ